MEAAQLLCVTRKVIDYRLARARGRAKMTTAQLMYALGTRDGYALAQRQEAEAAS